MKDYEASTYGERWASVYDRWYPPLPDDDPMIDRLAELAGAGPALELGVGTGRVALPLSRRGVVVHGIDASETMLDHLRAKPGSEALTVSATDMSEVPAGPACSLVFAVTNTFFALQTQQAQVRCFESVAARLTPEGCFVLETFVPDPTQLDIAAPTTAARIATDEVVLHATRHDPVAQRVDASLVVFGAKGIELLPAPIRYAWPSELDLMGRLAGLALDERWGGWRGEPFTETSAVAVSIFRDANRSGTFPLET